jgi:hypothetical protein
MDDASRHDNAQVAGGGAECALRSHHPGLYL